ncbi:CU044_5270 family protein [Streptomyces sp. NPDC057412]|uniref:CU044_5270 family protein n=1 Tax=Streptomyces sp. NPDC057412 TaxID=3346123 RepID=UPI00367FA4C2
MADELDLLRAADPVPADHPRLGDGPLDQRAERLLADLRREPPARRRVRWFRVGAGVRPRPAWALLAAVVTAVTLSLVVGGTATTPALAAPRPLVVRADTTPVTLTELARRARADAAAGGEALRKGTHVQSWSLAMSEDKAPITLPEERIVRWKPDGSHTELVVATDPTHPGRPVLRDDAGGPRLVEDGHVVSRRTYPRSWSDAPPQSPPPRDATRLRAWLQEAASEPDGLGTGQILDAVELMLDNWTLGARESAALAELLAGTEGLRPAGRVTDRLGRPGLAYTYEERGLAHLLIMDPRTGAVLGRETTFTRADPAYGVRAGDVMAYSAWMR